MKSKQFPQTCKYLICSLFLIGGVLSAKAGQAAIYYVAKTGRDTNSCATAATATSDSTKAKLTINSGIGCLASGDTLIIKGGTYNERLSTLSGFNPIPSGASWSSPTTIKGAAGETVTLNYTGTQTPIAVYLGDLRHHIIFDNLTLDGTGGKALRGFSFKYDTVRANSAHHIRVTNSVVKNFNHQGIGNITGTGHEFINNKVHDNGKDCTGSLLGPGHCHGFYISSDNTLIERNDVFNNEGYGIHIFSGGADNTAAYDNIIRRNAVYNNGIGGAAGTDTSTYGIILSSGRNNRAYNNIVWNNKGGIMVAYGGYDAKVYNNTIYGNTGGSTAYCVYIKNISGTVVRNNICYANGRNVIYEGSTVTKTNNLFTDPSFVDPARRDFTLRTGSTAIDAGATLAEVVNDYAGVVRPQAAAFDIGAHEYVPQVSPQPPTPPSNLKVQ